jgi:hypothetical protein
VFIDFLQFLAQYIIATIALRWLAARYHNTQWGGALAFVA